MLELRSAVAWGILASAVTPAACTSPASAPPRAAATPAAPAAHEHASGPAATAGPGFTVADVRFMQGMIGHHAQAVEMAAKAGSHGASESVVRLARKIEISQCDEIEFMKGWLAERRQGIPRDLDSHSMTMPGMLTREQLARLDAARGREFDRLFLTFMIRHHEGALQMVHVLFESPGAGQDPDIFRFVTDVDADQRDEILVMARLLESYATLREEPSR
jgi:uncharacterized protein (DUF305 family)